MIKENKSRLKLTLIVFLVLFLAIAVTQILVICIKLLFLEPDFLQQIRKDNQIGYTLTKVLSFILIAGIVSIVISSFILKFIHKIIEAIHQISKGNFSTRLEEKGISDFKELSNSINTMAIELENKEIFHTDFINNFSHEFKTPIVSIKGFAEILKEGNISEEEKNEYLDIIIEQSNRLTLLATNVLDLSRVENQQIAINIKAFNLTEQIRRCILLFDKQWEEKNINLSINMKDVNYVANEEQLCRVWINLIDNAVKFSPENKEIFISLEEKNNSIIFIIRNSGNPINKDSLPYIFDKFYKESTSYNTRGNGLGLAIASKIVTLYKGSISCNSNNDIGTEFKVILPI